MTDTARDARADWEARVSRRRNREGGLELPELAPPRALRAREGRGQVTLDWEAVDGAAGYLVERADTRDGDYRPLDIGEPVVRGVPHPPLTDTTGTPGRPGWYRVAAVANVEDHDQPRGDPIMATPLATGEGRATITVDATITEGPLPRPWRPIIGSEHLSQLRYTDETGGQPIGREFAEALRMSHEELGVEAVRAHAILHDELGTYREIDGRPQHDFGGIDAVYDRLLEIGLRPVVEISFMPRDLAADPSKTVFEYGAIVSPPKDWDRWEELVRELAAHLVDRYGLDEVRNWGFEVWNEANLEVFWSGTRAEYMKLYDRSVRAVRSVHSELLVGGPATAAVGWIDELLDHVNRSGAPIDFLSTHTYGQAPLDLRPISARHGRPNLREWWTEWGAHAGHFNAVHDSPWSAAYLVRGMKSAMGRIEALAYWVVSDHFEELGRPPALLHGGFGLLSVGNLRKPRWWALWMLEQLGDERLAVRVAGDGAGDMLDALATRDPHGRVALLAWNGTVDVSKAGGERLLDRAVEVELRGLPGARYRLRHRRLDEHHSNLVAAWHEIARGRDWPDEEGWRTLREADRLEELEPERVVEAPDGVMQLAFELPMPSVSLIELTPD
jgi:xylan 1,4-beta-xylosidase